MKKSGFDLAFKCCSCHDESGRFAATVFRIGVAESV